MDPVGYKGPLRAILLVGNFDAVAAVQHLLGLAMAVVLYLLLLRRGVPRWLAALATAPVLLDAYQVQIEQTIMPDTWFEALIVARLAILLWPPATGRPAAAADCATIRLPAAERGMCPTAAQQAKGPDWLEYAAGSPVRPYYSGLPRAEADSLISDFSHRVLTQQPLRVADAYAWDALKPFALTRDGRQGDTPIARWPFHPTFPYYPPHAAEAVGPTPTRPL